MERGATHGRAHPGERRLEQRRRTERQGDHDHSEHTADAGGQLDRGTKLAKGADTKGGDPELGGKTNERTILTEHHVGGREQKQGDPGGDQNGQLVILIQMHDSPLSVRRIPLKIRTRPNEFSSELMKRR